MPQKAFHALADHTRREILNLLRQRGSLTAGEIAKAFTISKPSISHHLTTLKEADLVQVERHGQTLVYSLTTTVFQDLLAWIMEFTGQESKNE